MTSVLSQNKNGQLFVVLSCPLAKLPGDSVWRTSDPAVPPPHDITPVMSQFGFFDSLRQNMRPLGALLKILLFGLLLQPKDSSMLRIGRRSGVLSIPRAVLTSKSQMVSCDAESSSGVGIQNSCCR